MKNIDKKDWKLFEETVSLLETALHPKGAEVTSPDYIEDLITGQKREVDAAIRYLENSVPILITVECRHRNKVQDDMWLEQLVTKQKKIGATKTIAVSSKGFTKPAQKTAEVFGIELRTCERINDERIEEMLNGFALQAIRINSQVKEFVLTVENDGKPSGVVKPHIEWQLLKKKNNAVIAYCSDSQEPITLSDLIESMHTSTDSIFDQERKIKGDTLVLNIAADHAHWYYPVKGVKYGIKRITIKLQFGSKKEDIPIVEVNHYTKSKTPLAQLINASLKLDENNTCDISLIRK